MHNRRKYGRLSQITEAWNAWHPARRCGEREKRFLTEGEMVLSELSYCLHNAPMWVNAHGHKPRHDLRSTSASLRRLAFLRGKICNAQKNKDNILEKSPEDPVLPRRAGDR